MEIAARILFSDQRGRDAHGRTHFESGERLSRLGWYLGRSNRENGRRLVRRGDDPLEDTEFYERFAGVGTES